MTSAISKQHSNRIVYIDMLRLISCFMIICVHISALNWEDVSVSSSQWQTMNFFDCISVLGVPLFFMISGAVFLRNDYELSMKQLYLQKILKLFLTYHIWLLFYNSLPFLSGELAVDFVTLKDELFLKTLLGKGIYHLWFLAELVILYIISPILKAAFREKSICRYFLVIFAITGAFLPTTFAYNYPYRTIVESYYDRTSLVMLTGYIGYFVLGHYLHSHVTKPLRKKTLCGLAVTAILCMLIVILACSADAITKDKASTILNTPLMLPQFIACSCIYLIVKNCCQSISARWTSHIISLSKYTMGIYLLHPFVIKLLAYFGASTLLIHPIIMIPVLTIIVFIICLVIVRVLYFIPILNKWLL
ncbi:MAG: acyltransferase family protein [Lachnospiraceae bacterium]|nr:acyltransferase family protein [Lachnospiraceae bacterium]